MRNPSALSFTGLLALTACEHTTRPAASVSTVSSADTSHIVSSPQAGATNSAYQTRQRPITKEEADYQAQYKAHRDSLASLASVLARADTAVQGEEFKLGDLNGDGRPDYLVLARGKHPCSSYGSAESYCRTVFIVLNSKASSLYVAASNDGLVGCSDCGGGGVGDPFRGFAISEQGFEITQLSGDCDKTSTTIKFRYSPSRRTWLLKAVDILDYSCRKGEEYTRVYKTSRTFGVVKFADASVPQ